VKIIVCDDETAYLNDFCGNLKKVLRELKIKASVSYCMNGNNIIKDFESEKFYDIVILDIDMPSINGKEVARKLRVISSAFKLIFVSSHEKEVYNTLQYKVDAFIPKIHSKEFLASELKRVIRECSESKSQYLMFEVKNKYGDTRMKRFLLNDIFCVISKSKKCYLYTGTNEYLIDNVRYNDFIKTYASLGFFETSRGFIVNLRHVSTAGEIDIVLDNDMPIPVSRRKRKQLLEAVSNMITFEVFEWETEKEAVASEV